MPKRMQDLPAEYRSERRALAERIGERLRLRREELGLTQEQVRARLELEGAYVSRTQYSRIENGDALANAADLIGLQAVLNVSFDWMLKGEERRRR